MKSACGNIALKKSGKRSRSAADDGLSFCKAKPPQPPIHEARKTTWHGTTISDPFHWLRADNWQDILKDGDALPEAIRAHLVAENRHTQSALRATASLRKTLLGELRGRIREDDSSPPSADGPFAYFETYLEGAEHPLIRRQPRAGGEPETLLDCERIAKRRRFFDLGDSTHSPDHRLLAWSVDFEGSEFYTIRVRDLRSGRDRKDRIGMTEGSIIWSADSSAFYYVRIDETHRPRFVMRHRLGTPETDDVVIYQEKSDLYFVDISETQSGAFAVINISGHDSSEEWLIDLHDTAAAARLVAPREDHVHYESDHHEDRLLIKTNADGAEDFKIVTAPLSQPDRSQWKDFVPHRKGVMLLSTLVLKTFMVRLEREAGTPRLVVHDFASGKDEIIGFEEESFHLSLSSGYEYDTQRIRFTYSSMTTPHTVYEYDLVTRERIVLKTQEIPSGHDPARYVTRRLMAVAPDGQEVPISILHAKSFVPGGANPCLLYAYGAYGYAMTPSFDSDVFSLVDRGFVYAIAHVRGGTDKGWHWYEDGKLGNKINSFTDYIAVARHLADQGFTKPGLIVAQGASAGGLLMGAIANMAPELFAGIIAEVPFVDVLNTILDADLPLTPPEWHEWGNPIEDETAFDYIRSYSPYDAVSAQRYPAILATGGLSDPRVTYWEPAKWVLKLRSMMTGGGPVLLKTNMDAGHSGASGRFEQLDEVAFSYAFALAAVNLAATNGEQNGRD